MNPASMDKRYFLLPRAEIGFLRFILESYDGLAFSRTLDPRQGLVEIAFPASRRLDVEIVLGHLAVETGWREVTPPLLVSPL